MDYRSKDIGLNKHKERTNESWRVCGKSRESNKENIFSHSWMDKDMTSFSKKNPRENEKKNNRKGKFSVTEKDKTGVFESNGSKNLKYSVRHQNGVFVISEKNDKISKNGSYEEISQVALIENDVETAYTLKRIQAKIETNPKITPDISNIILDSKPKLKEETKKHKNSEKSSQLLKTQQNIEFNIISYKTLPCESGSSCKEIECNYYHFEGEKRRSPTEFCYFPELCREYPHCSKAESCNKAHTVIEIIYHPQAYLSHFCPYSETSHKCVLGSSCNFKHAETPSKAVQNTPVAQDYYQDVYDCDLIDWNSLS